MRARCVFDGAVARSREKIAEYSQLASMPGVDRAADIEMSMFRVGARHALCKQMCPQTVRYVGWGLGAGGKEALAIGGAAPGMLAAIFSTQRQRDRAPQSSTIRRHSVISRARFGRVSRLYSLSRADRQPLDNDEAQ